jgi:hypothetical protein
MSAGDMKTVGPVAPPQPLQRSSASKTRANPRDLTGKRKQELEAARADELAQREQEVATAATELRRVREDTVVDYTQGGATSPSVPPAGMAPRIEEEPDEVEVEAPFVQIRVNAPIDDMVFGRAAGHPGDPEAGLAPTPGPLQFYSFEEGVTYAVPRALAQHLDRIGYVWH